MLRTAGTALLLALSLTSAPAARAAGAEPRLSLLLVDIAGLCPKDAEPLLTRRPGAVAFAQAISQSGETAPGAASLLTAEFVESHGLVAPEDSISTAAATLAEVLEQAGWDTGAFAADPAMDSRAGFARGFAKSEFEADASSSSLAAALEAAVRWAEARRRPFFLYFHGTPPAAEAWAAFQRLRRTCPERTVAVLTSDRGPGGGPELGDPRLRVPLLIWHPGLAPRSVGALVRLIDLAPAFLEWAGVAAPGSFQGNSLARLAAGTAEAAPRYGFSAAGSRPGAADSFAISAPGWRMVYERAKNEFRLYDLKADPGMTADAQERRPDVALDLTQKLMRHLRETRPAGGQGGQMSPELRDELRRKGYW